MARSGSHAMRMCMSFILPNVESGEDAGGHLRGSYLQLLNQPLVSVHGIGLVKHYRSCFRISETLQRLHLAALGVNTSLLPVSERD